MSEPKNIVDQKRNDRVITSDSSSDSTGVGQSQAGFKGPGGSVSQPGGVKPHSSKILNKLDPRFDADRLQEAKEGKLDETK
jgi:hypothetical protein